MPTSGLSSPSLHVHVLPCYLPEAGALYALAEGDYKFAPILVTVCRPELVVVSSFEFLLSRKDSQKVTSVLASASESFSLLFPSLLFFVEVLDRTIRQDCSGAWVASIKAVVRRRPLTKPQLQLSSEQLMRIVASESLFFWFEV